WRAFWNMRSGYVSCGHRPATFGVAVLNVERVLQYSGVLYCTWTSSCNIRRHYVARGQRLATFGGAMLHVGRVLQHSGTLIVTSHQTCQQHYSYCLFSPNVSTTTLLLSLLAKRVNNNITTTP